MTAALLVTHASFPTGLMVTSIIFTWTFMSMNLQMHVSVQGKVNYDENTRIEALAFRLNIVHVTNTVHNIFQEHTFRESYTFVNFLHFNILTNLRT